MSLTVVGGIPLQSRYPCGYPLLSLLVSLCRTRSSRYAHRDHHAMLVTLFFPASAPYVAASPSLDQS